MSPSLAPELPWPMLDTLTPLSPTERGLLMLSPKLMLPTLVTVIPMPTLVCLLAPALDWTPSPRAWTLPPRDMFLTTDTDITPTATTTARGLLMLTPRLTLLFSMVLMDILMALVTTLDMPDMPDITELALLPPTLPSDTPWLTPPAE